MQRATLVLLTALVVATLPAAGAAGASCGPAGGQAWPFAKTDQGSDFVFTGKGYGHGVGMSQFGARGAARLGCDAETILQTYYQGTAVSSKAMPTTIRVGLIPNTSSGSRVSSATFENLEATDHVPWRYAGKIVRKQPAGATWKALLRVDDAAGTTRYVIRDKRGDTIWRSPWSAPGKVLEALLNNRRLVKVHEKGLRYKRGELQLKSTLSGMYLTARVAFEPYLYGLAEMPSSWETEALKSQAIVGRSYAFVERSNGNQANCVCHLYDSTSDQVYTGWEKESEGTDAVWGKRWVSAVDATAGQVITVDGNVRTGNYASSHGGHSESAAFVWGGAESSHLQPIDDSRWEANSGNPNSTWMVRFTREQVGKAFGVGTALKIELPDPKGASGRIGNPAWGAGGVKVIGTEGEVTVSGDTARWTLGLRSTLFDVLNPPLGGIPITGDWNGTGKTQLGWYRDGHVALRRADGSVIRFQYGRAGDTPIVGDWDGNGTDTLGVVRGTSWYLINHHGGGGADIQFSYGKPGDIPMPGNWDGDPGDESGVIRDGTWYLNDVLGGGRAWKFFGYGRVSKGDIPIAGDWRGRGADRPGVVRGDQWLLKHTLSGGAADNDFYYGRPSRGDIPVVGNWGGTGDSGTDVTPGIVRGTTWHLRNSNSGGPAHRTVEFVG